MRILCSQHQIGNMIGQSNDRESLDGKAGEERKEKGIKGIEQPPKHNMINKNAKRQIRASG